MTCKKYTSVLFLFFFLVKLTFCFFSVDLTFCRSAEKNNFLGTSEAAACFLNSYLAAMKFSRCFFHFMHSSFIYIMICGFLMKIKTFTLPTFFISKDGKRYIHLSYLFSTELIGYVILGAFHIRLSCFVCNGLAD